MRINAPTLGFRVRSFGFSLIEIMIVLAIAAAVTAFAVNYLDAERRRTARGQVISDQAQDMATINTALEAYLATKPATVPSDGSSVSITSKSLSDLGFLPPRFAVRNNDSTDHVARSPLGQAYVIKARQQSGNYVGAVYTIGTPSIDQLAVLGMKATDEAYKEHNTAVMRRLKMDHFAAAGVILKNQLDTSSAVSGFTESMAPYESSVFADSNIVILAGQSQHRTTPPIDVTVTDGTGGGGGGAGSSLEGRACYSNTSGDTCTAGYSAVWTYQACQDWGPDSAAPTAVTVSLGSDSIAITRAVVSNRPGTSPDPNYELKSYKTGSQTYISQAYYSSFPGWYTTYKCSLDPSARTFWGLAYDNGNYEGADGGSCWLEGDQPLGLFNVGYVGSTPRIKGYWYQPGYPTVMADLTGGGGSATAPYTKIGTIEPCAGSVGAVSAPIISSGDGARWIALDEKQAIGTPGASGRYWTETVKYGAVTVVNNFYCAGRLLSNSNVSFTLNSTPYSFTNACPSTQAAANISNSPGNARYTGKSFQLFHFKAANPPKMALCCENK